MARAAAIDCCSCRHHERSRRCFRRCAALITGCQLGSIVKGATKNKGTLGIDACCCCCCGVCCGVVVVWLLCGCCRVVVVLLSCCCVVVVVLLWCCCGVVVVLLWCCCGVVVVLLWCCCGVVVWLLCCCCGSWPTLAKTDFGQTEFDLCCVFVCLCCVFVCVFVCVGVCLSCVVWVLVSRLWFGHVECPQDRPSREPPSQDRPFPGPPSPWTAQNFALFFPVSTFSVMADFGLSDFGQPSLANRVWPALFGGRLWPIRLWPALVF